MQYVALLLLAAGGWFFGATWYRYRGYAWADESCASIPYFCDSPYLVLGGFITAAAILYVMHTIRSS
jgi:hypothetical protein